MVIVDHDADPDGTNNLDPTTTTGCVRIDRNSTTSGVRCIDNTTAKTTPTQALFSGNAYRYKFWHTLYDFNERSGGGRRFLNTSVSCFLFVRATAAKHVVNAENKLGVSSGNQAGRIVISGYPGERPEIWCGNSMGVDNGAEDDSTPVARQCPWSDLAPNSGTATIFQVNWDSAAFRNNIHFRNIWLHGKRETTGGDYIFASRVLNINGHGTNVSVRFCKFTDCQPMRPDDGT